MPIFYTDTNTRLATMRFLSASFFLWILFLFLPTSGQAQRDYQLFRPGVQYLYEQPGHEFPPYGQGTQPRIVGMQLKAGDCATAYPSLGNAASCMAIVLSFAGYTVCQKGDTTLLDFRAYGQMRLLTNAVLGQEWTAMETDTGSVRARVTDISSDDFLGLRDSVNPSRFTTREAAWPSGSPFASADGMDC